MNILGLLVFLIIIGVCFWAVQAICGAFNIPAPISTVVQVLLVIIALVWLLQAFGVGGGNLFGGSPGPALRIH